MKNINKWKFSTFLLGVLLILFIGIVIGTQVNKPSESNTNKNLSSVNSDLNTSNEKNSPTPTTSSEAINSDETSLNYDNGESLRNGVYKSQELINNGTGYLVTLIGFAKDKKIFTGELRYVYQNGSIDEEPEMGFIFYDEGFNGSSIEWPGFTEKNDASWYRKSVSDMGIQFNCEGKLRFYYNEESCRFYFAEEFPE